MGETVDAFRLKTVSAHLFVELLMNRFITTYISKTVYKSDIGGASIFSDLILEKISFGQKVKMIERIFKESYFNQSLPQMCANRIIKNKKNEVVEIEYSQSKSLNVNKLIKSLEGLNSIRNHLLHRLVLDLDQAALLKNFKNSAVDMNKKGDEAKLIAYKDYVSFFFEKLEIK